MKATGLTSFVLRRIFVPSNQYGCSKIESKCFRARFIKIPQTRLGNSFQANLDTFNSKNFTGDAPTMGRTLQYHISTMQLYEPVCPDLSTTLLTPDKYIFICSCIYHFLLFSSTVNNDYIRKCFLRNFCLLLLFHLLFQELWKLLYQLNIYQQQVFKIFIKKKNTRLFSSLSSAIFELSGSSLLVKLLSDTV